MADAPERIWLNNGDPKWWTDEMDDRSRPYHTEYVRADLYATLEQGGAEMSDTENIMSMARAVFDGLTDEQIAEIERLIGIDATAKSCPDCARLREAIREREIDIEGEKRDEHERWAKLDEEREEQERYRRDTEGENDERD